MKASWNQRTGWIYSFVYGLSDGLHAVFVDRDGYSFLVPANWLVMDVSGFPAYPEAPE